MEEADLSLHVILLFLTLLCSLPACSQISFPEEPVNTTVVENGKVSLQCVAMDTLLQRVHVSWRKGSGGVLSSRFHLDTQSGTLSFPPVQCDDAGWYTCVATDGSETAERSVYLTVLCGRAPTFVRALPLKHSFTNVRSLGATAVVQCYARGDPPPAIRWEKEGQGIPSSPAAEGPYATGGTLHLVSSQPMDSGVYCCVAENELGTATQNTTVTIVEEVPSLWLSWWMWSLYCAVVLVALLTVPLCCRPMVQGCHSWKSKRTKVQNSESPYAGERPYADEWPANWDQIPIDPTTGKEIVCHVVELNQSSTEYREVEQAFSRTMQAAGGVMSGMASAHCGILKIQRIQNQKLYAQYIARKTFIDKSNPEGHENERRLFHGCDGRVTNDINHEGLNRNFAGKNATALGRGVYFARDAKYSARDTYTPPDANGHKHMYYARVLTGQYTWGNGKLLVPPPKDPSNPAVLHESVVDNMQNPSIFVVFQDAHVYPEYLITFH